MNSGSNMQPEDVEMVYKWLRKMHLKKNKFWWANGFNHMNLRMNSDAFGSLFSLYSYSVDSILGVMCKPKRKINKQFCNFDSLLN